MSRIITSLALRALPAGERLVHWAYVAASFAAGIPVVPTPSTTDPDRARIAREGLR